MVVLLNNSRVVSWISLAFFEKACFYGMENAVLVVLLPKNSSPLVWGVGAGDSTSLRSGPQNATDHIWVAVLQQRSRARCYVSDSVLRRAATPDFPSP